MAVAGERHAQRLEERRTLAAGGSRDRRGGGLPWGGLPEGELVRTGTQRIDRSGKEFRPRLIEQRLPVRVGRGQIAEGHGDPVSGFRRIHEVGLHQRREGLSGGWIEPRRQDGAQPLERVRGGQRVHGGLLPRLELHRIKSRRGTHEAGRIELAREGREVVQAVAATGMTETVEVVDHRERQHPALAQLAQGLRALPLGER